MRRHGSHPEMNEEKRKPSLMIVVHYFYFEVDL